jgi:hypothetical protein
MALGFDGAIPLNCASTYPGVHSVTSALARSTSASISQGQKTVTHDYGAFWFGGISSPKSVDVSQIDGPFAGWMSRTADGPADLDYGLPFSKLNCTCSYPPPWGGWLFLQPASLFNTMPVIRIFVQSASPKLEILMFS